MLPFEKRGNLFTPLNLSFSKRGTEQIYLIQKPYFKTRLGLRQKLESTVIEKPPAVGTVAHIKGF